MFIRKKILPILKTIKLVGKSKFILKPYEDFVMLSKFVKPYVLNLT